MVPVSWLSERYLKGNERNKIKKEIKGKERKGKGKKEKKAKVTVK